MDKTIGNDITIRPKAERGTGAFVPGDVIAGRYVVEKVLGEGGMGIVYQCLDKVGGVSVAVKCLPPEVSRNADEMEDIRANYQIVRKLRHPNIAGVATLEKDAAGGDYYLVMDLAAGVTLKRWARRHPDAGLDAKLAILRQVAAALDYAHDEKVIHRDVKPENVMVDDNGRVKVLDFGLAAQIRSSQSRTSNTVTSKGGTPGYKSPEQWLGRPQKAPADVYAFGVMAYWLFSGHLPFDGDDPVVLGHAVLSAPVGPIHDLPAHMNAALAKALAKAPEDRFTSCTAFMDALEGKAVSRVEHVERVDDAGRGALPRDRMGSRHLGGLWKPILATAALALATAGGWWFANARAARSTGTTGVSPVATNDTKSAPTSVSHRGSGASAALSATNVVDKPAAKLAPVPVAKPVSAPAAETVALKDGDMRTFVLPGGVKMEMIYVEPGTFTMGSPTSENGRFDSETPHRVRLTKGYWIGKYPVTQAQWDALVSAMGVSFENRRPTAELRCIPTKFIGNIGLFADAVSDMDTSDFPMESISWNDCKALVDALNGAEREGWRWALPTEAQWEFAARGGNKSRGYIYSGGDDMAAVGWYYENSGVRRLSESDWKYDDLKSNRCRTHSVKEKDIGNELGIVGMSGNVFEWCNDWYDKDYYASSPTEDPQGPASGKDRVLRGGSWHFDAKFCRSAFRRGGTPSCGDFCIGFRLCCSAGPRE